VLLPRKNTEVNMKRNYQIVRTYSAGVFAGTVVSRKGQEVVMTNARRLWCWTGAASLSQLAMEGTKTPSTCKFPCPVARVELMQAIEILDCTKAAQASIEAVPEWKM
jgi:hypothetical protein